METNREKSKAADWMMVILTFFTLIAAVVSAWLFEDQLVEARQSTDAAICNFVVDERGWVELDSMKLISSGPLEGNRKIYHYAVYPRNVGKTVAKNIVVRGARIPAFESMLKDASAISSEQAKLVASRSAPLSRILAPNTSALIPLKIEVAEPKMEKNSWAYNLFLGRIDYEDQFGTQHWMTFCYYFERGGEVLSCHYGNDEDRNAELMPGSRGSVGKSCLAQDSVK